MKRYLRHNIKPFVYFIAITTIGLVGAVAFGKNPFTALPFVGLVGAVAVRGSMDQLITVKFTHTAETTKDTIYLLGGRVMLAVNGSAANAENVFLLYGHIEYAKAAGETWVGGQTLYWDDTAKNFTTTEGDNTKAGFAMEEAASADTSGQVFIDPVANL